MTREDGTLPAAIDTGTTLAFNREGPVDNDRPIVEARSETEGIPRFGRRHGFR